MTLAHERHGVVVPGAVEAWRELQAALQQLLGVGVAPEARGDFRQHAQRRNVGRMLDEVAAQQRLGFRDAVLAQRRTGGEQARIACRGLEQPRAGRFRSGLIADGVEMIGERAPGVGQLGIELHAASQGGDGFLATSQRAQCQAELAVGRRPSAVRLRQRCEHRECRLRVTARTMRDALR